MFNLKKHIALALALVMLLTATPMAYAVDRRQSAQITTASREIAESMKMIIDLYMGGDVSVNQLSKGALRGMLDTLDPYSCYLAQDEFQSLMDEMSGQMVGLGVYFQMNDKKECAVSEVVPESPAAKAGILKGDVITAVNDVSVYGWYPQEVQYAIYDSPAVVKLAIERNDAPLVFSIEKAAVHFDSVRVEKLTSVLPSAKVSDDDKIGYMRILEEGDETPKEFAAAIKTLKEKNIKKVIMDMRGNPGGSLDAVTDMCNMIVPAGPIFSTVDKNGRKEVVKSALETPPFEKIIILTDNDTASAAELITAAMQDAKAATVVGQTTFGKGVVQTLIGLPDGDAIKLTVMEYFSRDGKPINNVGIKPDITVPLPDYVQEIIRLDKLECSPDMANIKKALVYLGYEAGPIGTYYDEATKKGVKKWQQDKGLTVDGKLSYETLSTLNAAIYDSLLKNDPVIKKAYEVIMQ